MSAFLGNEISKLLNKMECGMETTQTRFALPRLRVNTNSAVHKLSDHSTKQLLRRYIMRVAACLLTGRKKQATCFDSMSKEFVSPLSSTRRQSPSVRCEERIEEQGIITKLDIRWVSNQFPNEIQSTMIPKPKDVGKFAWNLWKYEPPNNTDETSIQIVNQKQKNVQLRTFLLTSKYKSIREKLLFRPETGQLTHHSITHHKRLRKRRSKNYITNTRRLYNILFTTLLVDAQSTVTFSIRSEINEKETQEATTTTTTTTTRRTAL